MSDPDRHLHVLRGEELDEDARMTPEALRIVLGDLHSRVADAAARLRRTQDQDAAEVGE